MNYDDCMKLLKKYNQEHLLYFYDELNDEEKNNLLNQISNIDFEYMKSLFFSKDKFGIKDKEITSIEATDKNKIDKVKYSEVGEKLIKDGKLAICSMAGGQGTRLGYNGPKGTFMLDLDKPTSIFETIIIKLKKAFKLQYINLLVYYDK